MKRLFGKMKKEKLEPGEKAAILSKLQDFVAQNPPQSVRSPFYSFRFYFWQRSILMPTIVFLVFLLTGGTVAVSRRSLPGDTLYPIKMLSENIESKVAFSNETTAKVNTYHAVSRLKEVEQLVASEKPLDKETRVEIEKKFEVQAEEAISNINKLESTGNNAEASKIRKSFVDSLAEREQAMKKIIDGSKTRNDTKEELSSMISNIQAKIGKASKEDKKEDKKNNSGETASSTPVELSTSTDPEIPDETASTTPSNELEQPATTTATSTPQTETPEESATSTDKKEERKTKAFPKFWR